MADRLVSVGIDVGTTTTQVVFSHIMVEDLSSGFTVPRIEIVDKRIVYRGQIHFTPLLDDDAIDLAGVARIVEREYAQAGVAKDQLDTGAVVITGQTARRRNASEVLHHLSDYAGDFVVAVAGPRQEAVIAGRGAGADVYSKVHGSTAGNYDIGGGTSNFALFDQGRLAAASCLDIGGRLVQVDPATRRITAVVDKTARLAQFVGLDLAVGQPADLARLERLAEAMADLLAMSLGLLPKSAFYPQILTEPGRDVVLPRPLKNLSFSGGVADHVYAPPDGGDPFRYGDIGVLLGQAVRRSPALAQVHRFAAAETIRATVVGAGSHTVELSGSTIEYDADQLPLKSLPILKLSVAETANGALTAEAIQNKLDWFQVDGQRPAVAIAFAGPRSPSFAQAQDLAAGLLAGARDLLAAGHPLVVITENDLAKILGQSIRSRLPGRSGLVCVDAVRVEEGDYVDIGTPTAQGRVLPVVVKTLLFA
ncbi:MAG: ethanolamine ammonia-lyase reactivating factor EutA [Propionibacteriaceae bacterium]|jgi:ethanolamine utilization protein EutA|nr:ethanolamine ammonia-lyase reactivating factor EutA [Propionibacteriaceae bacterium]